MRTRWYPKNKEIHKQRANEVRKRGIKWLQEIKALSGCIDCGLKDFRVLDFDHVTGEKKFNIGHELSFSKQKVINEINKCNVRCSNCHRIKTWERNREKKLRCGEVGTSLGS